MNQPQPEELLQTAILAVQRATQHAQANLHRRQESIAIDTHDIKLALDVECQAIIEETILSTYPQHAILGEEGEQPQTDTSYQWIVDPIDGTVNFSHSFPYWCSSVAVQHQNNTLAGAVLAPESNELFTATIDSPAHLNHQPIYATQTAQIRHAMILTGLNKSRLYPSSTTFETLTTLAQQARKIRITGAAALDLCQIAAGRSDGFLEYGLYQWDFAAASLIAQRAGATFTLTPDPSKAHRAAVLCANPALHNALQPIWTQGIPHA
jgi:myo-inositol-1(or 4)-monophosphatase